MTVRECNPPALFFLQKLYQPVPIEKVVLKLKLVITQCNDKCVRSFSLCITRSSEGSFTGGLSLSLSHFVQDDHQMDSLLLRSFLDFNEDGCKIETSVNVNEENPEDNDQKPQRGMKFSSVIEAEEFYKNYAKKREDTQATRWYTEMATFSLFM